MNTPICDCVARYLAENPARFHMPGHKGRLFTGAERGDITEIRGADDLYAPRGIIRESEENAARIFGSGRTLYSAEGSSQCIRAMLAMAAWRAEETGLPRRILAGRNAHKTLMTAAALLDLEIDWLMPEAGEGLLSCTVRPEILREKLAEQAYAAVYLTSPDYIGHLAPADTIAAACRGAGVPLLVDNAHGAYLKFLEPDRHPISLGADLCCDSAHKTLPCLTGAAYLHIGKNPQWDWAGRAKEAMALFGSTSPSWLILQSLDRANPELAGEFPRRLAAAANRLEQLKARLRDRGWRTEGDEPMKLTLAPRSRGYTGEELAEILEKQGIICEFADPDFLTLMPSAETAEAEWERLEKALEIGAKAPLREERPDPGRPERVLRIREAMLAPAETVSIEAAEGRILADAGVHCPPAVPIRIAGERIDAAATDCFRYYGIRTCRVVRREKENFPKPLAQQRSV